MGADRSPSEVGFIFLAIRFKGQRLAFGADGGASAGEQLRFPAKRRLPCRCHADFFVLHGGFDSIVFACIHRCLWRASQNKDANTYVIEILL
jgi:hypothetical protein